RRRSRPGRWPARPSTSRARTTRPPPSKPPMPNATPVSGNGTADPKGGHPLRNRRERLLARRSLQGRGWRASSRTCATDCPRCGKRPDSRSLPPWRSLCGRSESMLKDLAYALRALRRSPGFAAAAVLSLALGLGANTALFSAVDAALLRPLSLREPDRLVLVWSTTPRYSTMPSALPDLREYRDSTQSFDGLASYHLTQRNLAVPGGEPRRILAERSTADLPRVLGVGPERGRYFDKSEETWGN